MYFCGEFGSYTVEFGRSGGGNWEVRAAEKVEKFEKKIKITKCPEHAPKVSTSIEKVISVRTSLRKCILGTNLDHVRWNSGGLELKIERSGRRKKVKLFKV